MQEQSPPSRRKGLQLEVAVSGMIGLLALMVSAYTVYVQRQQLKVQAWPRLALVGETRQGPGEDDVRLTLSIQNRGLAPAEIRWMRVSVAGEAVNDWLEWLRHLARRQGVTNVDSDLETSDSPVGSVISVGGEAPLFTARSRRDLAVILADNETAISICYCSVLDDWWMHEALEGGGDRVSQQERE
jgi:hypothetical protein